MGSSARELVRKFRKMSNDQALMYFDNYSDADMVKVFELFTVGERLAVENVAIRWKELAPMAWSGTTTEDLCDYFKSKKDLTMDDVIHVLERCAQYLTHICLMGSHHKIKHATDVRKGERLFKLLTERAESVRKIHWDFEVPVEPLMTFYEARIHQLQEHDNKDYCTVKTERVMRLLKKAQNLKTFNWTVGVPERCLFYRTRSILEALPEDLTTLNINCTEDDFSIETLFRPLERFDNLRSFTFKGGRLSTDRTGDLPAQLPASVQHVEIDSFGEKEFIRCMRDVDSLRHLSITGGKFRAEDLVKLVEQNPNLEHLALRNMDYLCEKQFAIVAGLSNLTSLHLHKLLRLDGPSFTSLKKLQVIHVSYCRRVWLESLLELADVAEDLREIQIADNPMPKTEELRECLNTLAVDRECTITLEVLNPDKKKRKHYSFPKDTLLSCLNRSRRSN
ncbi:uncharacterized protein LOC106653956 [Trichogramma pretiosum]|uniref:uncharacterized protein LOC106653956 n=1 Tax=Trichogramma pretiosum TaxID=7493 RepID=UPI0006C9BA3A|nr:uncharacterized protein LOC106653956 [Trichogramma pretiosum]